jgi:hypothetical protein
MYEVKKDLQDIPAVSYQTDIFKNNSVKNKFFDNLSQFQRGQL